MEEGRGEGKGVKIVSCFYGLSVSVSPRSPSAHRLRLEVRMNP